MTSMVEELSATRRQLATFERQAAEAREEAAEALTRRREAEEALAELRLSVGLPVGSGGSGGAGGGGGASLLEVERRMSSELLGAATREKEAQAELLGKNVAAFEKLIASKEEQLQGAHDRLQVGRLSAPPRHPWAA